MVGLLVFTFPATASAYNTYVGLKIESVYNPNYSPPTEWCLPLYATTMILKYGADQLDFVRTTTHTCPGSTIWSNLVTIVHPGEEYTLLLNSSAIDGEHTFNYPKVEEYDLGAYGDVTRWCLSCAELPCSSYVTKTTSGSTSYHCNGITTSCTCSAPCTSGWPLIDTITCGGCLGASGSVSYEFSFTAPAA